MIYTTCLPIIEVFTMTREEIDNVQWTSLIRRCFLVMVGIHKLTIKD